MGSAHPQRLLGEVGPRSRAGGPSVSPRDPPGGEGGGGKDDWRSLWLPFSWNYKTQKASRQGALVPDLRDGNWLHSNGKPVGLQQQAAKLTRVSSPVRVLRGETS